MSMGSRRGDQQVRPPVADPRRCLMLLKLDWGCGLIGYGRKRAVGDLEIGFWATE